MDILLTIDVPPGTDLDGAVVELSTAADSLRHMTAEVRIPAPAD